MCTSANSGSYITAVLFSLSFVIFFIKKKYPQNSRQIIFHYKKSNVKTFTFLSHTFVLDKNSYSVESIHLKSGQHWEFVEVVQAGIKMFKTCLLRK